MAQPATSASSWMMEKEHPMTRKHSEVQNSIVVDKYIQIYKYRQVCNNREGGIKTYPHGSYLCGNPGGVGTAQQPSGKKFKWKQSPNKPYHESGPRPTIK